MIMPQVIDYSGDLSQVPQFSAIALPTYFSMAIAHNYPNFKQSLFQRIPRVRSLSFSRHHHENLYLKEPLFLHQFHHLFL
jgi:hypothetical protein